MSQATQVIKRGWKVLREEGPTQFLRNSKEYLRRVEVSKEGVVVSYQTGARVDFEDRWKLLSENIDQDDTTVLDIGCAEGHLTAKFAEAGLFSIGIERQSHVVNSARKSNGEHSNLGFLQYDITPETIDSIPKVDVILLLTVYHHWMSEYEWEAAEEMLRTLRTKCDKLFFEMPDRELNRPPIPGRTDDSLVGYYTAFFEEVYEDVSARYLGSTDYKGGDRDDLLFVVDFEA